MNAELLGDKRQLYSNTYPETLWRALNTMAEHENIATTDYSGISVLPVRDISELYGRTSYYVSISSLLTISTDLKTQAKLDEVSKTFLERAKSESDSVFVSYKLSYVFQKRDVAKSFLSPVIKENENTRGLSLYSAYMGYFDAFTSLKVAENWFLARQFRAEIDAECLKNIRPDCSIINVGRALYSDSVKPRLPNFAKKDVTELVCIAAKALASTKL